MEAEQAENCIKIAQKAMDANDYTKVSSYFLVISNY